MNTSHHDGGAPDVFSENASAPTCYLSDEQLRLNPSEINSDNIIPTLRRVFPEVSEMKSPDGSSVSWDNAAFNLRKKRVTLYVFFDHMRPTRQEEWAEWEWLHYRINSYLEHHMTHWRFRYVPRGRRVVEVVK